VSFCAIIGEIDYRLKITDHISEFRNSEENRTDEERLYNSYSAGII